MGKIIGIDLGSYNSCVSVMEGNEIKVIPNSEGGLTTPSYVSIINGEIKVGEPAKRQGALKPTNVVFNIKRLMGKSYEDVKNLKRPYKIVNSNGRAAVEIDGKVYSPEEISAMILQKMKKTAEEYLGQEVKNAVVTVPAFFNDSERSATKTAGEIAGLTVERVVAEPTAAILNVKEDIKNKKYAVLDFGGQTMDMSIIDVGDGVYEILATHGDLDLGGSIIDYEIVQWLVNKFKEDNGVDLSKDVMALQRLYDAAERSKIELSNSASSEINLPYITSIDNVPKHLVLTLTRPIFDRIAEPFIDKVINIAKVSLEKSGVNISDIDDCYLVGGSTRIPFLQEKVEKLFGKAPNKSLNPDTCVSTGSTTLGGVLNGDVTDILLLDVIPISIGLETMGNVFTKMIEANTTIPTTKKEVFSTSQDNQPSVQISVLQGERPMANQNKSLGQFILDSLMPAPRGVPKIEISFNVDANGILEVSAIDQGTGKQQKIRIEASGSLTDVEIERMKKDAEINAEADKKLKEQAEKLNEADSMIFQSEKQLKEYGEKLSEANKTSIETALSGLKTAHTNKDVDSITSSIETLNSAWQTASTDLYNSTSAPETPEAEPTQTDNTSDNTQDVEFEEIK